jgi:glycosyltransferase involved in cell wall biosynthesis
MTTSMTKDILLSVIIPTKNRRMTCAHAVMAALAIPHEDIEIIVQDCSDSTQLKAELEHISNRDSRIKYEHLSTSPSMTENWNRAYERASGKYQCAIGDDDAVLPHIYDVAKWAEGHDICAVGHSRKFNYFWPDYTAQPEFAGKLYLPRYITKNIKILSNTDIEQAIRCQAVLPNMSYRDLPMAYHNLISLPILRKVINDTGIIFDGTAVDAYSAIVFGLQVHKYAVFDYPFTIPGACGQSNSNVGRKRANNRHLGEYKKINADKRIPRHNTVLFVVTESTLRAFHNTKNSYYSNMVDLPLLYANFLAEDASKSMRAELLRLMREHSFTSMQKMRFSYIYIGIKLSKLRKCAGKKIKMAVSNLLSVKKQKKKKHHMFDATTITEAMLVTAASLPATAYLDYGKLRGDASFKTFVATRKASA